jgi:hypothetical protein
VTLLIALLLLAQSPVATANFQSQVTLTETGDNAPALNSFLAQLPDGCTVTLAAGTFPLNSAIVVGKKLTLQGGSASTTSLKLIAANTNAKVIRIGDYNGNVKVNGCTVRNLTLEIAGDKTTGLYNCLEAHGDDTTVEDCTFKGCPHEGLVVSGNSRRAHITRCRAEACGTANQSYTQSTAGFNSHSHEGVYTDCVATGCGQGFEIDGHHTRVIRCRAENPHGVGPSIAFNVGSVGTGIWDVELSECTSVGYPTAVQSGNGIGRFANLNVHDCVFDGGSCHVMGGIATNSNPALIAELGQEGPDTGLSHVDRNVFIVRAAHQGVLGFSSGPEPGYAVFGREQWTFNGNVIQYVNTLPGDSPVLFIGGKQDGAVEMKGNRIFGMDTAPSRGDLQTFTNGTNVAIQGQPNLTQSGNLAFKLDGIVRPLDVRIEGSSP